MLIYGYNQPGCLPDTAEALPTADDLDEAKRALIEDILRHADQADDETEAEELSSLAEDVNLWDGPGWASAGGLAYWIEYAEDEPGIHSADK